MLRAVATSGAEIPTARSSEEAALFRWLKTRSQRAVKNVQRSDTEDIFRLDRDENSRAIRPRMLEFSHPDHATNIDRRTALTWAADWCALPHADIKEAAHVLDAMIGGSAAPRKDTPENRVARTAMRALSLNAEENRAARTARMLPYQQFRLGPQEDPCACAKALADRYFPVKEFPRLPLPGCTAIMCSCWARSVTKREFENGRR